MTAWKMKKHKLLCLLNLRMYKLSSKFPSSSQEKQVWAVSSALLFGIEKEKYLGVNAWG